MRLTNFLRDSFVRAAMADVPKVNYTEQAEKLAREFMKKEFARVFPKIDMNGEANDWLEKCSLDMPGSLGRIYTVNPHYGYLKDKPIWEELKALAELHSAQHKQHRDLQDRLTGVAYACTTRKQLLEALPEFEAYLPEEEAKAAKNLPALANVLSDFVKAGWPKNQPKMPKVTP